MNTKNELMTSASFARDDDIEDTAARVIQGIRLKFTNDGEWVDSNEDELPPGLKLVFCDRQRLFQKWGPDGGAPLESRFLQPGEPRPDIDALNEATPKSEWRSGFDDNLRGPFELSWCCYLFDPVTGQKYTYITSTTGGNIAIGEISEKTRNIQRIRGETVFPLVQLSSAPMKTRFAARPRPRPDFKVLEFVRFAQLNDGGTLPATNGQHALPSNPPKPMLETKPAEAEIAGLKKVEAPSIAEEINDEIPF